MPYFFLALIGLAFCTGCRSGGLKGAAKPDSSSNPFGIQPPIADADPSIRHSIPVRLPTSIRVERKGGSLTVSFPTIETNLWVGHKMVTGITTQNLVYRDGVEKPRGMSLQGGLDCEWGTQTLTLGRDGIPEPGQEFTLGYRVIIFETDEPAQHLWSPQSGKHYRVLWTQTFKEAVR